MLSQHVILAALWFVFAFSHSAFAAERWKVFMQRIMKGGYKYYRVLYSSFSFLLLGAVVLYHFNIKTLTLWQASPIELVIALAGLIIGGSLMIFFARKFFFDLSGADVFRKTKKTETLIQTSFYKYVRHPLYTSTLLLVWSIFFLQPMLNNLISCICITIYTVIGIRFEEKKLVKDFGESYIEYKSRTPMLIPKIY